MGLNGSGYPVKEDGQWHRWAGRRLAYQRGDGALIIRRVTLLRWALRWGGDPGPTRLMETDLRA